MKLYLFIASFLIGVSATAQPVKNTLPNDPYMEIRGGLDNARKAILEDKELTVAYLGGSITFMEGWRNKTSKYLEEKYPQTRFTFIRAAVPSLGSLPHSFRISTDVPDLADVDLLFFEAAVNDRANGTDSITQVRGLEGVVRQAKAANPKINIIMMAFVDPDKIDDYHKGKVPVEVINHEKVAGYYNLPSINLARLVNDRIDNGEFTWKDDFKDLHPSPFGQEVYFSAIKTLISKTIDSPPAEAATTTTLKKPLNPYSFTNASYYDIKNARLQKGWQRIESFKPEGVKGRDGFINVPVLEATTPGAMLSLPFKGRAIGVNVNSGPDAGILEYSIDGGPFQKLDLFTQWSHSLHLPWFLLFESELPAKSHVLRLRVSEERNKGSKGNAVRVVRFLVNE
ncbi:MAG: SGNH/GDSL hydrolase family protein [Daejeonella sp.]